MVSISLSSAAYIRRQTLARTAAILDCCKGQGIRDTLFIMQSLKLWTQELLALFGAVASFIGLVVLLATFHGRPIFDGNGVTLNTIISTLSVVMKALVLFATAECIGQWKWIIFCLRERELMDFERIDLASRGPLGSLCLAWRKDTP